MTGQGSANGAMTILVDGCSELGPSPVRVGSAGAVLRPESGGSLVAGVCLAALVCRGGSGLAGLYEAGLVGEDGGLDPVAQSEFHE